MEQNLYNMKCNVTITLPINVLAGLDELVKKGTSRNKIVNEAIENWLQNKYNIKL